MSLYSTQYRPGKKKHRPCCPKCKIPFAERVPRSAIERFLLKLRLPLTKYRCYRCKLKYYTIRKRKRRYSKYERSQVSGKSLEAVMGVNSGQLIHNSQSNRPKSNPRTCFPCFSENEKEALRARIDYIAPKQAIRCSKTILYSI